MKTIEEQVVDILNDFDDYILLSQDSMVPTAFVSALTTELVRMLIKYTTDESRLEAALTIIDYIRREVCNSFKTA